MTVGWDFWNDLSTFEQFFLILAIINLLLHLNSLGPDFFSVYITHEKRLELFKLLDKGEEIVEEFFYFGPKSWDCKALYALLYVVLLVGFLNFYITTKVHVLYLALVVIMFGYIFYKIILSWYKWCLGSIWAKRKALQDKSKVKLSLKERLSYTFLWVWVKFLKNL